MSEGQVTGFMRVPEGTNVTVVCGRLVVSLAFGAQMYLMMAVFAVFFTPWAILSREGAFAGVRTYCRWVRWTASWMVNLRYPPMANGLPIPVEKTAVLIFGWCV